MNIPKFAQVLGAIIRHNFATAQTGGKPRDYLVPMVWAIPGSAKRKSSRALPASLESLAPKSSRRRTTMAAGRLSTPTCRPAIRPNSAACRGSRTAAPSAAARTGCRSKAGEFFLDELPQAGLANMNIAASLIRDHRIGEHVLPPTWMVVCAGNHQHNRAGTTTMPSHVRNRLVHLTVEADVNAWAAWAARRGIAPMLIAYNRYRASKYHHRFSATENAYPSPRSWAMADRVLQLPLPEAVQRECIAGAVGGPAGADFTGFEQVFRSLPDVDAILLNPEAGPLPDDPMTSYALMGALAHRATPRNFAAVIRYLDRLPEQEFSVVCVVDATARDERLMLTAAYQAWAAAHGTMLSGH